MTRLVRGADGRMWTVRSRLEWADPVAEEEFEHDVSGDGGGALGELIGSWDNVERGGGPGEPTFGNGKMAPLPIVDTQVADALIRAAASVRSSWSSSCSCCS